MTVEGLIQKGTFICDECGMEHCAGVKKAIIESGAVNRLPELIREAGAAKPFILSGEATYGAAGKEVCGLLDSAGIAYSKYVFPHSPVLPTEGSVGSAVLHFDYSCDIVIGVGSGVINDIGKLLSKATGRRYTIVATAPSMDGYVSGTSSMEVAGLKESIDSAYAWAVVGDIDILKNAPSNLLAAGVGDMIAKYTSLAEWRISKIINGEYFCKTIADTVSEAINRVVGSLDGLTKRDPQAVKAVMDGLILSGICMNYSKTSRPASGMEHYFSHIIDMRSLAFPGLKNDLHGIQCGTGTLFCTKIYSQILEAVPDIKTAREHFDAFDKEEWNRSLRSFIGQGAESMIINGQKAGTYVRENFEKRLDSIAENWELILDEIRKLPSFGEIRGILVKAGIPLDFSYLGYGENDMKTVFPMTRDIRNKYIGSTLCFDLGITDRIGLF